MKALHKIAALMLLATMLLGSVGAAADTLFLPEQATVVGEEAFAGTLSLDRVVLPWGMLRICARAFAESGLKEIALPGTIIFIDENAFADSGLQRVFATKDTYAWKWAKEHGYIPEDYPLSAVVACESTDARVGDTVTWTGQASDALAACRWRFALYVGDNLLAEQPFGLADRFTYTLTQEGSCRVEAEATDGFTTVKAVSATLNVDPPPVRIDGITVEKGTFIGAETHVWKVKAADGRAPYSYRFTLKEGTKTVGSRSYGSSDSFAYTFLKKGTYTLSAQVKDSTGEVSEKKLKFTVTPKNLTVKAKVRIYVACDDKGNIVRTGSSTGHYDLQLSSGSKKMYFDDHKFTDPTIIFGKRGSEQGVVKIYDGSPVPMTGYKLYTFEFKTSTNKVAALLYDKLRDTYLNTSTETKNKKYNMYNYDVQSGAFKSYKIATNNCFTAVAAWCKLLGYGGLSTIAETSTSYADYLAWKLYDKYGKSWKYEGKY